MDSQQFIKCSQCKETKPINDYHTDNSRKTGKRHNCKICESIRKKEYYDKAKNIILNKNRKYKESDTYKNKRKEYYIKYQLNKLKQPQPII